MGQCEALFTVLTIKDNKAILSGEGTHKEFGTCSEEFSVKENDVNVLYTVHPAPNDIRAKSKVAAYSKKKSEIVFVHDMIDKESLSRVEQKMKTLKFHQFNGLNCIETSLSEYIKSLETLQKRYKTIDREKIGDVVMDVTVERYDDYGNIEIQAHMLHSLLLLKVYQN
jgi:hypothetical protein